MFVCSIFKIPLRRVWGLAFSSAGEADTFAFSLQGALEALGLEEERRRRREQEQEYAVLKEEMTRQVNNNEEIIEARDGEGGWSPRRER